MVPFSQSFFFNFSLPNFPPPTFSPQRFFPAIPFLFFTRCFFPFFGKKIDPVSPFFLFSSLLIVFFFLSRSDSMRQLRSPSFHSRVFFFFSLGRIEIAASPLPSAEGVSQVDFPFFLPSPTTPLSGRYFFRSEKELLPPLP